ncbi:MAG: hypothetical protein O7J95_10815 [Planctomycetota bacterium]|nr:hypothetical protein [Planctomycetota bacterium]
MPRWIISSAVLLLSLPLAAQSGRDAGDGDDVWKSLSAKYDANQDGRIDLEEYTRGEDKFRGLDRNGDGSLTSADFEGRGRRRGGRQDFARMMASRVVRAADADGSGDVTKKEWAAFLESLEADDDGVVDEEKLQSLLPGRGGPGGRDSRGPGSRGPGEFGRRMVQMMDRDGDERLEISDLEAIFSELDRDESGTIETGEMGRRGSGGRGSGGRGPGGRERERGSDLPQKGDVAPDFELPYAKDENKLVRLSSFAGKRPVALVFGSYT